MRLPDGNMPTWVFTMTGNESALKKVSADGWIACWDYTSYQEVQANVTEQPATYTYLWE
jgi:hypothetical protein